MSQTQWDSAPFNEKTPPPITEKFIIRQTMVKEVELSTTDYNVVKGEDGCAEYELGEIDWDEEYSEQHYTIQKLLAELKKYVEHDISSSQVGRRRYRLKWLLKEMEGWECEESIVEEE